jgi:hypothetical protein
MFQDKDIIKRMIEALANALARILRMGKNVQFEEARAELHKSCGDLLGLEYQALSMLDIPSVALLLRDPERVRVYADLVDMEAQLAELAGDGERAVKLRERAVAVLTRAGGQR